MKAIQRLSTLLATLLLALSGHRALAQQTNETGVGLGFNETGTNETEVGVLVTLNEPLSKSVYLAVGTEFKNGQGQGSDTCDDRRLNSKWNSKSKDVPLDCCHYKCSQKCRGWPPYGCFYWTKRYQCLSCDWWSDGNECGRRMEEEWEEELDDQPNDHKDRELYDIEMPCEPQEEDKVQKEMDKAAKKCFEKDTAAKEILKNAHIACIEEYDEDSKDADKEAKEWQKEVEKAEKELQKARDKAEKDKDKDDKKRRR